MSTTKIKQRRTPEREKPNTRPQRQFHRINEMVKKESGGARSICVKCGKAFDQKYREKYGDYTNFKMCDKCRIDEQTVKEKEAKEGGKVAVIPYAPHPKQKLVHDSKARFKVLAAGARFGKDRCMVMEFIQKFCQMLSEERGPDMVPYVHGWIVAPTYILARQVWRELETFFPYEFVEKRWAADLMFSTINGGIVEVRSADDPNALVSVGLDIVLITEAAKIKRLDEVWANIETRLMSPGRGPQGKGGIALINSTPKGSGTFFYSMYRWGQKGDPEYDPDWESWRFTSLENPYLVRDDLNYFERLKKRYPERIYRQEVLAEFIAEGNSVFPTAEECATYTGSSIAEPGENYVIGWDPARSIDFSGVVVRNSRGEVVRVEQWGGKSWTTQISLIEKLSRIYNFAHVVVDRTGVGETLPEALVQRGISVEPILFSGSGSVKENMVNHLALLIEQKAISYPNHPALVAELKDYSYKTTDRGTTVYGNTGGNRKHDDLVTALMLAFHNYNIPEATTPFMGLFAGISKQQHLYS